MDLKAKTERLDARNPEDIARAAGILRHGGTVAFPTETVYGLGANALSNEAVAKIFEAKMRPGWDPLIVHVSDREMLRRVADWGALATTMPERSFASRDEAEFFDLSSEGMRFARELIQAFWPGPLTLLLPRSSAIPDAVTAGRPLVGVRMPNHPVALELIRLAGVPIAAPSANLFGHISPTRVEHVLADLDGRIDAVLDGGETQVGVESTVAGLTPEGVTIYRPGAITPASIDTVLGCGVAQYYVPAAARDVYEGLPSPGVGLRHYAPRARLILVRGLSQEEVARSKRPLELSLVDAIDRAFDGHEVIGVMLPEGWNASCAEFVFHWGPWHEDRILAHRLYAGLRGLDDCGVTTIVCPVPESPGIAEAIRDRLLKAAKEK